MSATIRSHNRASHFFRLPAASASGSAKNGAAKTDAPGKVSVKTAVIW